MCLKPCRANLVEEEGRGADIRGAVVLLTHCELHSLNSEFPWVLLDSVC